MIGYIVPLELYPYGYHCTSNTPLPYINIASQKNFVVIYHMGLYMKPELMEWLVVEYEKIYSKKLDVGKSCIRFKKESDIPFKLIKKLVKKISIKEYILMYEAIIKK